MEWLNKLIEKYPPPENPNNNFNDEDIAAFEKALGTSLPADFYAFLHAYGYGTFSSYIYINYPFTQNGSEIFMEEQQQRNENYNYLEADYEVPMNVRQTFLDCRFIDGEPAVTSGNPDLLEFMRCEKIDSFTRSKIIAFGNHFPYPFYPEEGGLLFIGWSDDDDSAHRLGEFTRDMGNVEKIELLPYHELGKHKWVAMGEEYKLDGVKPPKKETMERVKGILEQYGHKVMF